MVCTAAHHTITLTPPMIEIAAGPATDKTPVAMEDATIEHNRVGGEINLSDADCLTLVREMLDHPASGDRRLRRAILTSIRRCKYKPTTKKRSACRPCEDRKGKWKPSRVGAARAILTAFANGNALIAAPQGLDADGFTAKVVSSHATYHAATEAGVTSRAQLGVTAAATCARVFDKMVELQVNGDGGDWSSALFKSQTNQQRAKWLPQATKGAGILMNDCGRELFKHAIAALKQDLGEETEPSVIQ